MACAPSKTRHRTTNALVGVFGEENGDGGGWVQLEVHALHSPFFAPTSKVERYPGHIGVASHGVMVGFTQFHHLVVVGGAEGVELLGTGRTPRSAEFGCVKGDFRPQRGISTLFFVKQNRADGRSSSMWSRGEARTGLERVMMKRYGSTVGNSSFCAPGGRKDHYDYRARL